MNMERGNPNDKILSYNDVVLRRSDLTILSRPYFLNDRIIEFYFSHLTSQYPSEGILLVPPSVAFWIKECPDKADLKDFVQPLHLSQKKLIMFPINDNADVERAAGGTHWSLLVFERDCNLFVHHDSNSGYNSAHAKSVYRAVVPYSGSDAAYVECLSTPRQMNGYDCGLYVTAIARVICEWYAGEGQPKDGVSLWFEDMKEQVSPCLVAGMRFEILELVRNLMQKQ